MTDTATPRPGAGGLTRRGLLRDGARVGGAMALASLGADALDVPRALARRRSVAPYRQATQPNILVILVDELRAPQWFGGGTGATGYPAQIAQLARRGVSFLRHYTASNDCTPARSALLTGLHTHQTGCMITGASTLHHGFPTWGTMLRDQGYATYWYGKWHLTRGDRHWNLLNGPAALERYGFDGGTFPSPNGAPGQGWRVDPLIATQFDQWFREVGGNGPWCTTVSFVNPHDIAWWWRWSKSAPTEVSAPSAVVGLPANFETPAQLIARGKPDLQRSLQDTSAVAFGAVPFEGPDTANAWLPFLDLYVKLQREVDLQIGRVLATLARSPRVMENTIVVFTSDHGEYGGSHGLRGKGAGMYEEAIKVPLIVTDFTGRLGAVPNSVRHQLTSSVDIAPMLLTLASGSNDWRLDARYEQIAQRPDIAQIVRDPAAQGRRYALHTTDEVITEFALLPHAAHAPLHVAGIITANAKYATYTHWQPRTLIPRPQGEQAELYDYTSRGGYLEIDNLAGRSTAEDQLRATLEEATRDELHAPLPTALIHARRHAMNAYYELAQRERQVSSLHRLHTVQRLVGQIESHLP